MIQNAPDVDLAAVVDPDPDALLAVDGMSKFACLEEAVARVECDAVLVSSPPDTHHAVAKAALEAGKHVLCEKPLATSLVDALDLIQTARRTDRTIMVSQNYRFNAPFRALQSAVADNAIGSLVSVEIDFRRDIRNLFAPHDFRYSMRHPLVMDMAIHHFDLLRAATGRNVRYVNARGWHAPDSPFAHHPEVAAVLNLDGGVPVVYRATWAARESETSWNGEWEMVGEEGRLLWTGGLEDRNVGEVTVERWDRPPRTLDQPPLQFTERAATLQALRNAVQTGTEPETSAADNINSLAVVLGCSGSIDSGGTVEVPGLMAAARDGKV